jgi:hypothetical protein
MAEPIGRQAPDGPQLPNNPDADPDRIRRRADEILGGNEYQAPEERDTTLLDRIRDWVDDLSPDLSGPAGSGAADLLSFVVVGLVLVAAIGGTVWIVATSRRRRAAPDDDRDTEVELTPIRTATEWEDEAVRCEHEGDHRGAVRARFRSLTTSLAARHLVADTPGRTAGELRGDVAERAPALVAPFEPAAELFERVWFGAAPAGPEQSRAARDLAERALAAAPRSPVATATASASAAAAAADGSEPT